MRRLFLLFALLPCFISCERLRGDHPAKVDDVCTKMDNIVFMNYCYDHFDVNHDGKVSMEEAEAVSQIDVDGRRDISSLKGIEYFKHLTSLSCFANSLSVLDVSSLSLLEKLNCRDNNLTSLVISHNSQLEELNCSENNLHNLDISHNAKLSRLDCSENKLASLDLSSTPGLVYLDFTFNNLASIDLTCTPNIRELYCSDNSLQTLDLLKNTSLTSLECDGNELTNLDLSSNQRLAHLVINPQKNNVFVNVNNIPPSFLPKKPTGLYLFSSKESSLVFQWNIMDNVASYYWELFLEGAIVRKGNCQQHHVEVSSLKNNTEYRFSVRSVNSCGMSEPSWLNARTR